MRHEYQIIEVEPGIYRAQVRTLTRLLYWEIATKWVSMNSTGISRDFDVLWKAEQRIGAAKLYYREIGQKQEAQRAFPRTIKYPA